MRQAIAAIGLTILTACTTAPDNAGATTITTKATSTTTLGELEAHRRAREQLEIDRYHIVYTVANLNGMGGFDWDGTHDVVVEDGEIVACSVRVNSFDIEECDRIRVYPDTFRWLILFEAEHTDVTYDPVWHMPSAISYDVPDSADEEYEIRLISLEPLD